jgi:hypothetical protein
MMMMIGMSFKFRSFLKSVKNFILAFPWAHYTRANETFVHGVWLDSSGNGRHASTLIGSGPLLQNRTLSFTPNSGLQFPASSIPSSFSIVVVARFVSSSNAPSAIFSAVESPTWLLGWANGSEDVVQFSTMKTNAVASPVDFKFRKIAASNSALETVVLSNGMDIGNAAGGTGGYTLVINQAGRESDCQVQEVIIYDGWIYASDLLQISNAIGS